MAQATKKLEEEKQDKEKGYDDQFQKLAFEEVKETPKKRAEKREESKTVGEKDAKKKEVNMIEN